MAISPGIRALALVAIAAVAAACSNMPAPTPAPSGSEIPDLPTSSPTDPSEWHTYHNQEFGFSFDIPAAYESAQSNSECGLWEQTQPEGVVVHWGMRSTLAVFPSHGASADDVLRSRLSPDATQVELTAVTAHGISGWKATYRFGGPGRLGLMYAFEAAGFAFAGSYTAGPGCEPPGFALLEPAVFDHAMQTLTVNPPQASVGP